MIKQQPQETSTCCCKVDIQKGSATLVLGCMFSGKTTELMRLSDRYRIANKSVVHVKHSFDDRYSKDSLCSHDMKTGKGICITTGALSNIIDRLNEYDVIAIDEGQFFEDITEACCNLADNGKIIIVSALNATYDRTPFLNISRLIAQADDIIYLKAVCVKCGANASFSNLVDTANSKEDPAQIVVGGTNMYRALCRECFLVEHDRRQKLHERF